RLGRKPVRGDLSLGHWHGACPMERRSQSSEEIKGVRRARSGQGDCGNPQRAGAIPPAAQLSSEITIMKRTLFAALTALTMLAAAFSVLPSSSADGLAKSKAAVTFNLMGAFVQQVSGEAVYQKRCARCHEMLSPRVPHREALMQMSASRILRSMDFGS